MNIQAIDYNKLRRQVEAHPYPLVFATISGAHLYGFPSADSDFDLRGVHLLPLDQVVGLDPGEETVEKSGVHDGIEMDLVTHDAKKFFGLMLKKNGYVLEQLLSPLVVHTTPEHEELKAIAKDCITRHHSHHYLGFAETQWKLFRKEDPPKVKPLLYVYRVLLTGVHLMRTGEVEANLLTLNEAAKLPYISDLVERKLAGPEKGRLDAADLDFHEREFRRLVAELESAGEKSALPEQPKGRDALNQLLLQLRHSCRLTTSAVVKNSTKPKAYSWKIRCINSTTKEMFDRQLVFDRTLCRDEAECHAIEQLLTDRKHHGNLVKYRHTFREVTDDEFLNHLQRYDGFQTIFLMDYFEDENGKCMDVVDLIALRSGQANPVIMGNVSSVLRLRPSEMRNADEWTVQDSNDFVHFIQVVGILQRSRWWSNPPQLRWSDGGPYTLSNPDLDSTTAALALIRQFLLRRDDVFRNAAKLYLGHVDNSAKAHWVNYEVQQFESHLKSNHRMPAIPELNGVTNEELIDVIIYGTGLFHRKSDKNLEGRLAELTARCVRERLMFACDSACRMMLNSPFTVAPLLYREFAHWSNTGKCPRPTRVVTPRLFETEGHDSR